MDQLAEADLNLRLGPSMEPSTSVTIEDPALPRGLVQLAVPGEAGALSPSLGLACPASSLTRTTSTFELEVASGRP